MDKNNITPAIILKILEIFTRTIYKIVEFWLDLLVHFF